jgi:hypothetical protein
MYACKMLEKRTGAKLKSKKSSSTRSSLNPKLAPYFGNGKPNALKNDRKASIRPGVPSSTL